LVHAEARLPIADCRLPYLILLMMRRRYYAYRYSTPHTGRIRRRLRG
jgi:hypothetical protein